MFVRNTEPRVPAAGVPGSQHPIHREHFPTRSLPPEGLTETFTALVRAATNYLDARLRLLLVESRDASRTLVRVVLFAVIAVLSLGLAYIGAWVAIVLWISAHWWHGSLLAAVLCAMAMHVLILLAMAAAVACSLRGRRFFPATRREFQEDRKWLGSRRPPPR